MFMSKVPPMLRLPAPALPLGLAATFAATLAAAGPATPEGAAALTATFQTYLGSTAGVVTVQPEGEVYGVKLDFSPLLLKLPGEGVEASVSPLEFKLTDHGDGTWGMTEDQALAVTLNVPGALELSLHVSHLASSGTFDSALQAFSQSTTTLSDVSVTETYADPTLGMTTVTYAVAEVRYDSTGTANPVAGVDIVATYLLSGLSETFRLPALAPDAAPMELTATAASYSAGATLTGLRPAPVYRLLAFAVAHPSEAAMTADWPEFLNLLGDGIPLFDHLHSKDKMTAIAVVSPVGKFTLAEAGIEIEANGIVADGRLREAISLDGLALPEGLVPAWATGLVPTSLSFDLAVTGFDAAAFARAGLALAEAVAKGGMVETADDALLGALLPTGTVDLTLAPGGATAPTYALTYQGSMMAGPAVMPLGEASITLTGLAAIREAVKAAPEDWGMQAAPVLAMAEGLARRGADGALIWDLELNEAGAFLVNGADLAAMTGEE